MELKLGNKVVSADGRHVGFVDAFVLNYTTRDIDHMVIRSGHFLEHDRLIDRQSVDHVDDEGTVSLSLTVDEIKKQPEFFEREFVVAEQHDLALMPDAWVGSGTGSPAVYFGTGFDALGYNRNEPFFGAAPVIPPETEVRTNINIADVVIDSGTAVVASDGKTIGHVGEVSYGPDGSITGFVVRAGLILHHDVDIPAKWIETVGTDHVRLNVTASEVHEPHPAG
ncbi:MAG: hypothetical protein WBW04_04435 [Nitrolancea sp.]